MELRNILIYIGLPIVLLVVAFILYFGVRSEPLKKVELVFWGFENEAVFEELIKEFGGKYPFIKIQYFQKSPQNYERELLSAMAAGQGPDVFFVHHTWLPRFKDKMAPLLGDTMSLRSYADTFVDVASTDFILEGSIWAVPLSVDTLALYWNKDIFSTVGIPEPPKNWSQFNESVSRLTIKDEAGNIVRSGAALGTALNVNFAPDILSLIMLQNGTKMIDEERFKITFDQPVVINNEYYRAGEDALRFYTSFATRGKTVFSWDARMGDSLDVFLQGKAAMMFGYSSLINEILEKSPYLNFGISFMPQINETKAAVNYANYWGMAVWNGSQSTNYAWKFILWLADKENAQKYASLVKKPVSRRDLISWQQSDLYYLGVFATQALSARSWFQIDNKAIGDIFKEMIESVVLGKATEADAVARAANQINLLMEEYTRQ